MGSDTFLSSENASLRDVFGTRLQGGRQWSGIAPYSRFFVPLPELLFPRMNQRNAGPGGGPGEMD